MPSPISSGVTTNEYVICEGLRLVRVAAAFEYRNFTVSIAPRGENVGKDKLARVPNAMQA